MKRRHFQKSREHQEIAMERINILFNEAKKAFREEPEFSNRYVRLARKIAMKYKIKIPSKLKRQFCKKCLAYLVPGVNLRVRAKKGHMVYCCQNCRHVMRVGYKD